MGISLKKVYAASLFLAVVAAVPVPMLMAEEPATAPTTAPARTMRTIMMEARTTHAQLSKILADPAVFSDAAKRQDAATQATPLMQKLLADADEIKNPGFARQIRVNIIPTLAALGDAPTNAELEKIAAGTGPEAINAKGMLARAAYLRAGADPVAQLKTLETFAQLAKAAPDNEELPFQLMMIGEAHSATPAVQDKVLAILKDDMTSKPAKGIAAQIEGPRILAAMEKKPLTIAGVLNDGKPFSSADWKGKVILVDFWATWCGPCLRELPRVKKMYQTYHDKGLEVLGVSNDQTADALTSFIKKDGEMPWPQLFDADAASKGQLEFKTRAIRHHWHSHHVLD